MGKANNKWRGIQFFQILAMPRISTWNSTLLNKYFHNPYNNKNMVEATNAITASYRKENFH